MKAIPKDCRRCGVCCCSSAEAYVRVTGEDWHRLGEAADRLAHFIGNRAYMRMKNGRCAALVSEPAGGGASWHLCSVYEYRPQVCRDLQRGSPECEAELARKTHVVELRQGGNGSEWRHVEASRRAGFDRGILPMNDD